MASPTTARCRTATSSTSTSPSSSCASRAPPPSKPRSSRPFTPFKREHARLLPFPARFAFPPFSRAQDGFYGDLNETFVVGGAVSDEAKALIKCAHDSLSLAIAQCKPGARYRDLGETISAHVRKCGFAVDRTYCGHGIGETFHQAPSIPHYGGNKAKGVMKAGHCFTIEPMINQGSEHCLEWDDGWTVTTRDGRRSAQFEHTLLVTEGGVEVLTARTANSQVFWWEAEAEAWPAPGSAEAAAALGRGRAAAAAGAAAR